MAVYLSGVEKLLTVGAQVNLFKAAFVFVATLAICGCDPGKSTPPKQATLESEEPAVDIEAARKAAESGDAEAQYVLGVIYHTGRGVPRDDAESAKWMRLAADQGLADAQFNLGIHYNYGWGVPQDYAKAVELFRLAAEQGTADAMTGLG